MDWPLRLHPLCLLLCGLTLLRSSTCTDTWSAHLQSHHHDKAKSSPVLLCVVDEVSASTVLPVLIASVLALPGRLERRLTVVTTTQHAQKACLRVHSDCFLEEKAFSHKHVNFSSISQSPTALRTRPKVERSLEFLQVTWGKVAALSIAGFQQGIFCPQES